MRAKCLTCQKEAIIELTRKLCLEFFIYNKEIGILLIYRKHIKCLPIFILKSLASNRINRPWYCEHLMLILGLQTRDVYKISWSRGKPWDNPGFKNSQEFCCLKIPEFFYEIPGYPMGISFGVLRSP